MIDRAEKLAELERRLDVEFSDKELLERALTHRSFTHESTSGERPDQDNDRLEFLGDATIDLALAEHFMKIAPDIDAGSMTLFRARISHGAALAQMARNLEIGPLLKLGKGEENSGGRAKESLLENAFEALIGAIFIDAGYEVAARALIALFHDEIDRALSGRSDFNYKGRLQEKLKQRAREISYNLIVESGAPNERSFIVALMIGSTIHGIGDGSSRKRAEQAAAKEALKHLAATPPPHTNESAQPA